MGGMDVPRASIKLSEGNGFDFWNDTANIKNKEGIEVKVRKKIATLEAHL